MNEMYCVYLHISPTKKYYVGITRQSPEKRWMKGIGYKANKKFYNAIKKYGWENFEHIIVAENLAEEPALKMEMALIRKYDSFNNGYNRTFGGEKAVYPPNAYANMKKKLAKPISQYTKDGIWIRDYESISDAARKVGIGNSGISLCLCGKADTAGGFKWSLKDNEIVPYKKVKRKCKQNVYQISAIDGSILAVYESIRDAANATGANPETISTVYRNRDNFYTGGYYWSNDRHLEEKLRRIKQIIQYGRGTKKVICVTTNEIFHNARAAAEKYNISSKSVFSCCEGSTRYGGLHPETGEQMIWKYINEGERDESIEHKQETG